MGKIINNQITNTFSGQFGDDIVFRRIGNNTFFARKGVSKKPATPAQRGRRHLFAEAHYYVSLMLKDPEQHQWYSIIAKVNGMRNAHAAAMKDFMSKPEVDSVNTKHYAGKIGDVIHIKSKMLLKITRMEVTIHQPNGDVIESGLAVKHEMHWKYVATASNHAVEGSKLVITTYDALEKSCTVVKYLTLLTDGSL